MRHVTVRSLAAPILMLASQVLWGQDALPPLGSVGSGNSNKDVRVVQNLGAQVPLTASFRDRNGNHLTMGRLLSARPAVILPVFYRCQGVCSVEFDNLLGVLSKDRSVRVGSDLDVVILGIDPMEGPNDAKQKFSEAATRFPGLLKGSGWYFLTGDLRNIRSVTDALGFYFKFDAVTDSINHPAGLIFVTSSGQVSSYILRPNYDEASFRSDVQLAARSKVGSKSEEVFFGCIHIDPLTGERSLMIENILRLAGIVFLVLASAVIAIVARRRPTRGT